MNLIGQEKKQLEKNEQSLLNCRKQILFVLFLAVMHSLLVLKTEVAVERKRCVIIFCYEKER